MAKITMKGKGVMEEVAAKLHQGILDTGMSVELVNESRQIVNDTVVLFRVYDKFFYRANNRVSLSVQIIGYQDEITVIGIGSGGGQGAIFRMDWGAEEDFSRAIIRPLQQLGFIVV